MNFLNQKKGFLGYEAKQKKDFKTIIVPFGLEKTVSYGGGNSFLILSIFILLNRLCF